MKSKAKEAESLLKVHNVEILVIPKEEYFKGLNNLFDKAQKGELKSEQRQIILSSINELNSILTPERVKILKVIRDFSPQSISELAELLDRDRRNVTHDLMYLKGLGFVGFDDEIKSKKEKKPIVDYDLVHVTIPISGELSALA